MVVVIEVDACHQHRLRSAAIPHEALHWGFRFHSIAIATSWDLGLCPARKIQHRHLPGFEGYLFISVEAGRRFESAPR